MRNFIESYPKSSGRGALAPAFADHVDDVVLAADTLVRAPIPTGAAYVVFSFDAEIRVKLGLASTNLALPSASTIDGSGSELAPSARRIPPFLGDGVTAPTHICLRAPAACKGSLSFYA